MLEITQLLERIDRGETAAAGQLLPLIYDELRKLADAKLRCEQPGQTLDATALVHEVYLRMNGDQPFANRGHFFAAAAEAMRRILVEVARRKACVKHGGGRHRIALIDLPAAAPPDDLIALDEALSRLAERDPVKADVVKLRYFAGMTVPEVAVCLGISVATVERHWAFARTWLFSELNDDK